MSKFKFGTKFALNEVSLTYIIGKIIKIAFHIFLKQNNKPKKHIFISDIVVKV